MSREFEFVEWVRGQQKVSELVRVPAGDDLAVIAWPTPGAKGDRRGKSSVGGEDRAAAQPGVTGRAADVEHDSSAGPVVGPPAHLRGMGRDGASDLLVVGVDQVIEGRHFDSRVHSPREIGRKAMNRNLSDCAAMACLPVAALIALVLPGGHGPGRNGTVSAGTEKPMSGLDLAREIYTGVREAADRFYCAIVGGDTSSWGPGSAGGLVVSVTIMGRSAGVAPVTRRGAAVGDGIYVTGPLGGSILGRHMTFSPRISEARQLATYRPTGLPCIHAMIDLSDGLSRDLGHLLEGPPGGARPLGADLDPALIPIHADAVTLARTTGKPALHHALHDGEDYELLFTSPVRPPLGTRIGTVTEKPGIRLGGEPLETLGWEHTL